jgi:hypothetical protein
MPANAPGRLAVVIPVYGQEQLTRAVLRDIAREPWVDVIVVDNRGDFHLDVPGHVLYPEVNLGWAGGCNFALRWLIEHGRHEAFVLLNNDTRLSRGFFRQLHKSWRRTSAWLLGPVYDGVWPTQRSGHAHRAYSYRIRDTEREVPFLDGTCIFLPRSTLETVGFLDADTFPRHGWGIDFDYAIRVRHSGGIIWVTERAFVHHVGNGTAGLQANGWRDLAWDEMTRGMRMKWGIAWPRLLREPQPLAAAPADEAASPTPWSRQSAVFVLGTDPRVSASLARAVNLAGVPPLPADLGRMLATLGRQALNEARAACPEASAHPETLLASPVVADATTDAAMRWQGQSRPARHWFWNVGTEPALVPFIAAAANIQPVCVLGVADPADLTHRVPAKVRTALLAAWERVLRDALQVLVGLPVLVIRVRDAVDNPCYWKAKLDEFLNDNGVPLIGNQSGQGTAELALGAWDEPRALVTLADLALAEDATIVRQLADAVATLAGPHQRFPVVQTPAALRQSAGPEYVVRSEARDDGSEGRHMAQGRLRAEWAEWARYNQRRGVDRESLVTVLVSRGVPDSVAREELSLLASDVTEPACPIADHTAREEFAAPRFDPSAPGDIVDPAQVRDMLALGLPLPWDQVRSVLCVTAGDAWQGAAFAALGLRTTVVILRPPQLVSDDPAAVQRRHGMECIQADASDLVCLLDGREYDLVYQPVSACCLPDLRPLYQSVARLLQPGGMYWVEHVNPLRMQLDGLGRWSEHGYRVVEPITEAEPDLLAGADPDGHRPAGTCRHYVHSLQSLVGDMCAVGLELVDMRHRTVGDPSAPPGSAEHLASFVPPFIAVLARKTDS